MDAWEKNKKAQQRRQALRARALEYKGGKCAICGYDKCSAAMDFHHVLSDAKEFNISSRMTSWERIKKELDKCELLCSRCHREVHDGMHPSLLALNEDRGRDEDGFYMDVDPADLAEMDKYEQEAEARYQAACERDALELSYDRG